MLRNLTVMLNIGLNTSHTVWLLVYDNVDNYKAISELIPTKGGKILIISIHYFGHNNEYGSRKVSTYREFSS